VSIGRSNSPVVSGLSVRMARIRLRVASRSCSDMTSTPARVASASTRESTVRRCPCGNGWLLIRRRAADRRPPRDLAQMRRRAILTQLGIAGSGVLVGVLFLIGSAQTSGGDRFTSVLLALASFASSAWIFVAVWLFIRRDTARVEENGSDSHASSAESQQQP
jgi:hypothetical protein